jgi:hypothetical protein
VESRSRIRNGLTCANTWGADSQHSCVATHLPQATPRPSFYVLLTTSCAPVEVVPEAATKACTSHAFEVCDATISGPVARRAGRLGVEPLGRPAERGHVHTFAEQGHL